MATKEYYDQDALKRLIKGANRVSRPVATTYGLKGRNVAIVRNNSNHVTRDGVTVAESIDISKSEGFGEWAGGEFVKSAARKINETMKDGTTTASILTSALMAETYKVIAAGHNAMELRDGMDSASKDVLKMLDELNEPIDYQSKRVQEIATVSSSSKEVGKIIAEIIKKNGKDGTITVETNDNGKLEFEIVEGFNLNTGFASAEFATDKIRQKAIYEKPAIVITDQKITSVPEFLPLIEMIAKSGKKELVIFADEVGDEVMELLIVNKVKGVFNSVVVKAPAFGERRKDVLHDIAIFTGGTVISPEQGMTFDNVDTTVLGSAKKIVIGASETTILGGLGTEEQITTRIETLRHQANESKNAFEQVSLNSRASALNSKVAVIKVGGISETAVGEKKDKIDDAVGAAQAALLEGVVPGGGVTLAYIANKLSSTSSDSFSVGRQIVFNALEKPFVKIMENAGRNGELLLEKIKESKFGIGIDLNGAVHTLIDLKKAGVVDATAVTKAAVEISVSEAGEAITLGALVVPIIEAV